MLAGGVQVAEASARSAAALRTVGLEESGNHLIDEPTSDVDSQNPERESLLRRGRRPGAGAGASS